MKPFPLLSALVIANGAWPWIRQAASHRGVSEKERERNRVDPLLVLSILIMVANGPPPLSQPTGAQLRTILEVAHRAITRLGVPNFEADDVAQLTALKLLERWNAANVQAARARGSQFWQNYVAKAARRNLYDLRRSDTRRRGREGRAARENPSWEGGTAVTRATSDNGTPAQHHLARFFLEDAISRLPPQVQTVAELAFLHDRKTAEIATMLDVTERRVRALRLQAERSLADALGDDDE